MPTRKTLFFSWLLLFLLVILSPKTLAQTVQGGETTVSYTAPLAYLSTTTTPASNFSVGTATGGTLNTFILSVSPTVSIRIYLSNNTANACGNFIIQMFAAGDSSVNSFNFSLQSWQTIPLQGTTGLTGAVSLSVLPNGTTYVSSTAIAAPKVAIQIVNTVAGSCSTANVQAIAVITQVAVTSPLISNTTGTPNGNGTNVQGIIPQQAAGNSVFPIVDGGLGPAVNGPFASGGLDNFSTGGRGINTGTVGTFTIATAPTPKGSGETAIALERSVGDSGVSVLVPPWTCLAGLGGNCQGGNSSIPISTINNVIGGQVYQRNWQNSLLATDYVAILEYAGTVAIRQNNLNVSGANSYTQAYGTNPLVGSTLVFIASCQSPHPCIMATVTDTQNLNFQQIASITSPAGLGASNGIVVFQSTLPSTAAAESVTVTWVAGTTSDLGQFIELTGITPTTLTNPAISNTTDALGATLVRTDALAGNQADCTVTLSANTTTQLAGCTAPTTLGAFSTPVRWYITDIQINTTTAAGAGSTIQLKTGTAANCGTGTTNLSAIAYPNVAVGLTTVAGFRTPLIAPIDTAVCATQAGGVAGTSVVEVHGYLAP